MNKEERNKQIYDEVKNGKTKKEVAALFGLSVNRITLICDRQQRIEKSREMNTPYYQLNELLEFDTRSVMALSRAGITSLDALKLLYRVDSSLDILLGIRTLGAKTLEHIKSCMCNIHVDKGTIFTHKIAEGTTEEMLGKIVNRELFRVRVREKINGRKFEFIKKDDIIIGIVFNVNDKFEADVLYINEDLYNYNTIDAIGFLYEYNMFSRFNFHVNVIAIMAK